MIEINLTPEEQTFAEEVIASMAEAKGISAEQAAKDLFGMGLSSWRVMEERRRQQEVREAENFNPFAAARGEYKSCRGL